MSAFPIPAGDVLTLRLQRCKEFRCGCPEIFEALIDSAAFVNSRRIERGDRPIPCSGIRWRRIASARWPGRPDREAFPPGYVAFDQPQCPERSEQRPRNESFDQDDLVQGHARDACHRVDVTCYSDTSSPAAITRASRTQPGLARGREPGSAFI
jgi:hypothetical protein